MSQTDTNEIPNSVPLAQMQTESTLKSSVSISEHLMNISNPEVNLIKPSKPENRTKKIEEYRKLAYDGYFIDGKSIGLIFLELRDRFGAGTPNKRTINRWISKFNKQQQASSSSPSAAAASGAVAVPSTPSGPKKSSKRSQPKVKKTNSIIQTEFKELIRKRVFEGKSVDQIIDEIRLNTNSKRINLSVINKLTKHIRALKGVKTRNENTSKRISLVILKLIIFSKMQNLYFFFSKFENVNLLYFSYIWFVLDFLVFRTTCF